MPRIASQPTTNTRIGIPRTFGIPGTRIRISPVYGRKFGRLTERHYCSRKITQFLYKYMFHRFWLRPLTMIMSRRGGYISTNPQIDLVFAGYACSLENEAYYIVGSRTTRLHP
jgi:hypothetical protein